MPEPRIIEPAEARALLDEAGPFDDWSSVLAGVHHTSDVALVGAAPDLAHTATVRGERVKELEAIVARVRALMPDEGEDDDYVSCYDLENALGVTDDE